jgi:hypothetical protein
MFNTLFARISPNLPYIPEPTYRSLLTWMGDFIGLEEIAPGAEWSDVLACNRVFHLLLILLKCDRLLVQDCP